MNLKLIGWKDGLQKVNVSKLLRKDAGLGLVESKGAVDNLLDDKEVTVRLNCDVEVANKLVKELVSMGVVCEIENDSHCV